MNEEKEDVGWLILFIIGAIIFLVGSWNMFRFDISYYESQIWLITSIVGFIIILFSMWIFGRHVI